MSRQGATNTMLYLISVAVLLVFLTVIYRLVFIYWSGDEYRQKAERTFRNAEVIPKRGDIYSDDGSLLATSVTHYDIRFDAVVPKNEDFESLINPLSDSLSVLLGKPSSYYKNRLRRARALKKRYEMIARSLRYRDYKRILTFPLFNKGKYKGGVIVEERNVREYPLRGIAQRSVGYEKEIEEGKTLKVGLEGAFSSYLSGEKGRRFERLIAKGGWRPIHGMDEVEAKDGSDVISTINIDIQDIAHHALLRQLEKYKAEHGCVVVMEVATGEIKAISNLGREPNGTYSEKLNYAVGETFEPGSLFKVMSLITAMEEKGIDTTYVVDTKNGEIRFYGKKVKDSNHKGYGKISIARAMEVSSNTGIVSLIHDTFAKNPKQFCNRINQMHLNEPLGLSIQGEGAPRIPHPSVKGWSGISLEWMAFGYGLQLTPLQILTFYNTLANRGTMVKPRLIKEIHYQGDVTQRFDVEVVDENVFSKQTADKMIKVLENVVKRGTGKQLYAPDFSMAGKTGTAQKNYSNKEKLSYISSFAGFFPADNPKYSCIVVIHEPDKSKGYYGADVSGPVFKSVAQKIYTNSLLVDTVDSIEKPSAEVEKSYNRYYKEADNRNTMPNVVGMNAMDAVALLENKGAKVRLVGMGKVVSQSLAKGSKIEKNQVITLQLL